MGFLPALSAGFERGFERFREGYRKPCALRSIRPGSSPSAFLRFCAFSLLLIGVLGRDFFPQCRCGQIVCTCVLAPDCALKNGASRRPGQMASSGETIPKDELRPVLDNIGLPYSGYQFTYSNGARSGAPTRKSSFN